MKIKTSKRALLPFVEPISVPKDTEDPVVTVTAKNGEVSATITHPQFTLSFPVEAEIEKEGTVSWAFSDFRKALLQTKAKTPLELRNGRIVQEREFPLPAADPYPALSGTMFPDITLRTKTLAPLFAPLGLFPQKDPLRPWRNQIRFEKRGDGLRFVQCNGVHLASLYIGGDFASCVEESGVMTPFAASVMEGLLEQFPSALLEENDGVIGFLDPKGKRELLVRFFPLGTDFPRIEIPDLPAVSQFHLNPVGKEPFEKALLDRMREYRDRHLLEYPDLLLRFGVRPGSGGEYTVTAQLGHEGAPWESVLETTSPFLHGAPPAGLVLPAHDTVKALEAFETLTAFKWTERGVLLESVDFEDGVRHAAVFLHGMTA